MVGGIAAAATGALPGPAQRLVDSVTRPARHLEPRSSSAFGGEGGTRRSGQDRRQAVGGGHSGGQPQHRQGQDAVRPGSAGWGATGKANQRVHRAPEARPGGAHSKRHSAAPHAVSTTTADKPSGGAPEGEGEGSRPVTASPSARSPSPGSQLALS